MIATFLFASGLGSRPQEDELTAIEDDDTPFEEDEDRRLGLARMGVPCRDEHEGAAVAGC